MTFENLQTNNGNQKEILSMKKTFVKLQEEKVKLMQEDLLLEKQQEECDKQILALREKQKNLELEDDKQMELWNKLMVDFEKLKSKKQVILDKDLEIEKESKDIKIKLGVNRSKKENVMKQFAQLEKVQDSAMTKFEQMQQQKYSVEQRSEQFQSQSENFQSNFQQLTAERQKMEMMEVEVEKRYEFFRNYIQLKFSFTDVSSYLKSLTIYIKKGKLSLKRTEN